MKGRNGRLDVPFLVTRTQSQWRKNRRQFQHLSLPLLPVQFLLGTKFLPVFLTCNTSLLVGPRLQNQPPTQVTTTYSFSQFFPSIPTLYCCCRRTNLTKPISLRVRLGQWISSLSGNNNNTNSFHLLSTYYGSGLMLNIYPRLFWDYVFYITGIKQSTHFLQRG